MDIAFSHICLHLAFAHGYSSVCQWVPCTVHGIHKHIFFSKIFIKNEPHDTIHTFKNYFVIVFSVFRNKRYPNRSKVRENGSKVRASDGNRSQPQRTWISLKRDFFALVQIVFEIIYKIFVRVYYSHFHQHSQYHRKWILIDVLNINS